MKQRPRIYYTKAQKALMLEPPPKNASELCGVASPTFLVSAQLVIRRDLLRSQHVHHRQVIAKMSFA